MNGDFDYKLEQTPHRPGVYLMKDDRGCIIYIGKARDLKKRLASYFKSPCRNDIKTGVLIKKIASFDIIITASEKEALILESNLIKRHRPRYNVILKDDKRYPSLRLDLRDPYPKLDVVRKIKKDGALYFGPYSSASAVRQTLKFVNKTFKLRKCKKKDYRSQTRPCLHCQMQGCLAPCCMDVDRGVYEDMVKEAVLFLKGRAPQLVKKIEREMGAAAIKQDFEKAAVLRDKLFAVQKTIEKQVVVATDFKDRDVFGLACQDGVALITLLFVRGGFLQGTRHFNFDHILSGPAEIIEAFLRQYYEGTPFIPKEILLPVALEDAISLEDWLKAIKGSKVRIHWPQRGEKKRLVEMAAQNAGSKLEEVLSNQARNQALLLKLKQRLGLKRLPMHMECFDNSNISGTEPVAGMVVFKNGQPDKASYRTYRLESIGEPDDYAFMREVLTRRFGKGEGAKPWPDLLVVDGGKGQLNIALDVIRQFDLGGAFDIIGIAKKDVHKGEPEDKIFKPGRANPVNLGSDRSLLLLLQWIRDEAHRVAVSFHRRRRTKSGMTSVLDGIPGIGAKRKGALLAHFGSIKRIQAASLEELSALPGMNQRVAATLKKHLADGII
jgi:excinuclease ABC subunit C